MTDMVWALVALVAVIAAWDMVRRWAFATATRALKAELDGVTRDLNALASKVFAAQGELRAEVADAKLLERVKKLETVVIALRAHAETQRLARANPFIKKAAG